MSIKYWTRVGIFSSSVTLHVHIAASVKVLKKQNGVVKKQKIISQGRVHNCVFSFLCNYISTFNGKLPRKIKQVN